MKNIITIIFILLSINLNAQKTYVFGERCDEVASYEAQNQRIFSGESDCVAVPQNTVLQQMEKFWIWDTYQVMVTSSEYGIPLGFVSLSSPLNRQDLLGKNIIVCSEEFLANGDAEAKLNALVEENVICSYFSVRIGINIGAFLNMKVSTPIQ